MISVSEDTLTEMTTSIPSASVIKSLIGDIPDYKVIGHSVDQTENVSVLVVEYTDTRGRIRKTIKYRSRSQARIQERRGWTKFAHETNGTVTVKGDPVEIERPCDYDNIDTRQNDMFVGDNVDDGGDDGDGGPAGNWLLAGIVPDTGTRESKEVESSLFTLSLPKFTEEDLKTTVMLTDVDKTCCRRDIIQRICGKYGPIKKISIVTYRKGNLVGQPTGRIFIDYQDRGSTLNALNGIKRFVIGDTLVTASEPNGPTR
jgi:hypothetical protein